VGAAVKVPANPLPPAFRFKQSLAHYPGMLGPGFKDITPILRTPVFILEGHVRPVHPDLVTPETIRLPYPMMLLQAVPYDGLPGEAHVFLIMDNRTAKIPGFEPACILSILSCSYADGEVPQVLDRVIDIHLSTKELTYYKVFGNKDTDGPITDPVTIQGITFLVSLCMSALHAMTNDLLDYRTAGIRQGHRDRKLADRKLGGWGWTYRLITIDADKHAATAASRTVPGGTHASPAWHERRGHWRHLSSGKQVWVRHCEVGQRGQGGVVHDYLVTDPGG
jgi:hypothetical protein